MQKHEYTCEEFLDDIDNILEEMWKHASKHNKSKIEILRERFEAEKAFDSYEDTPEDKVRKDV